MTSPVSPPPTDLLRRRAQLVLIAVLFLGPLALAFWTYYGVTLRPPGRTNFGELITPARPLPDAILPVADGSTTTTALFRGHWSLVVVARDGCGNECRATLDMLRSARVALGHDAERIHRVLLLTTPCCETASTSAPDLSTAWLAEPAGADVLKAFATDDRAAQPGRTFIVDPLGNLMMSYPAGAPMQGLLRDLGQLLKLSHIG